MSMAMLSNGTTADVARCHGQLAAGKTKLTQVSSGDGTASSQTPANGVRYSHSEPLTANKISIGPTTTTSLVDEHHERRAQCQLQQQQQPNKQCVSFLLNGSGQRQVKLDDGEKYELKIPLDPSASAFEFNHCTGANGTTPKSPADASPLDAPLAEQQQPPPRTTQNDVRKFRVHHHQHHTRHKSAGKLEEFNIEPASLLLSPVVSFRSEEKKRFFAHLIRRQGRLTEQQQQQPLVNCCAITRPTQATDQSIVGLRGAISIKDSINTCINRAQEAKQRQQQRRVFAPLNRVANSCEFNRLSSLEEGNQLNRFKSLLEYHTAKSRKYNEQQVKTASSSSIETLAKMSQTLQSIHSLSMQLNQSASLRGSSQLDELEPQMTLGYGAGQANGGKFAASSKFSKLVGKKASRVKELLLQNLGKADRTTDELFQMYEENFYKQQSQALKLQKEFKNYVNSLKGAQEAGKSLNTCIKQSTSDYQSARHDLVCENLSQLEHLDDDLLEKLRAQVLVSVSEYLSQFNELRDKIAKRRRKLIDFDSSRRVYELMLAQVSKKRQQQQQHHGNGSAGANGGTGGRNFRSALALTGGSSQEDGLQSATSQLVDEARLLKLREQYNYCKIMYETINGELHEELPMVYEKKMKNLLMTLQNYFSLEAQFHSNAGKLFATASDVIDELPMTIQSSHHHHHNHHQDEQQHQEQEQQQQHEQDVHNPLSPHIEQHNHEELGEAGEHYAKTIASGSSGMGSSGGDSSLESSSSGNGSPTCDDGADNQVTLAGDDDQEEEEAEEEEHAALRVLSVGAEMHQKDQDDDDDDDGLEVEEEEEEDSGQEFECAQAAVACGAGGQQEVVGEPDEDTEPVGKDFDAGCETDSSVHVHQQHEPIASGSQPYGIQATRDDEELDTKDGQSFDGQDERAADRKAEVVGGPPELSLLDQSNITAGADLATCDIAAAAGEAVEACADDEEAIISGVEQLKIADDGRAADERKCLYKVRTSYKYLAEDVDELCFEADEIIQVIEFDEAHEQEEGWLMGIREVNGQRGLFPANFTRPV